MPPAIPAPTLTTEMPTFAAASRAPVLADFDGPEPEPENNPAAEFDARLLWERPAAFARSLAPGLLTVGLLAVGLLPAALLAVGLLPVALPPAALRAAGLLAAGLLAVGLLADRLRSGERLAASPRVLLVPDRDVVLDWVPEPR